MPAVALGLALLASVPRRVAMSVASLAAAVALAVAVLTFASSFRTTLDVWSANVLTGDLTIRPLEGSDAASASRFTSALLDRIRSVAGVAGVSGSRTIAFPLHGALVDVASDGVTGGRVASGDATFDDAAPGAVVDSAFAARAGLRIGDVFALPNVPAIRVVRIDPGDPLGEGRIALHRATFVRVTDDTTFDTIVVRTRPGADFGRLRARLARALAPRVLDIVTTHDLRARTIRRFDAAARETFAVAAVALAVGAAGIGVTLSALVLEFRDDLRLLRHVGLTRRATRSLVFAQAACVGSVGALLGSVCGIAIAFVSLLVDAARFGSPLRLDVPFGEIVAIVIASVLLAIVASAGPARVAARLALGGASRAVLGIVLIVASGHPLGATTVRRAPAVVPTGTERTVWRVLGHLHARDGSRYDVATTFFRYELDDVSDMKQRAPWQSRAFFSSATSIVDEDAHATTTGTRTDRGGIGFAHGDPATFDVGVDDWSLRPAPPGPRAAWRLRVATDLARVDLTLVAMRPVVALGTNGVVRTGSCRRCLASALALPRVDATGTLAYGTRRITVTGTFWIDRESGGPQLAPADRGWERFTVQFDDGRALVVRFVRDQRHRVVTSDGTFVGANGRIVNLEANDLVLEHPLGTVWRNDRGIEYPSLWDLYVRRLHLDLALVPDVQAQEIAVGARGAHFYLGSLDVERAHPGPRDPGRGFAESTGYEGSLTF
jgi:predicted secreted hydrolase